MEPVRSVSVAVVLAKVPLAPVPGAVKVTETPLTGLPLPSVTVATRGAPKAVPTVALWVQPPEMAMMVKRCPRCWSG